MTNEDLRAAVERGEIAALDVVRRPRGWELWAGIAVPGADPADASGGPVGEPWPDLTAAYAAARASGWTGPVVVDEAA